MTGQTSLSPPLDPSPGRFELNPLEKVGRMMWKGVNSLLQSSSVAQHVLDYALLPPDIGIEKKESRNFGRQVSWSWNQTVLTEAATKQTAGGGSRPKPSRQMSRQLSGLHSDQHPPPQNSSTKAPSSASGTGGVKNVIKKAISRGFSRELSPRLSPRGGGYSTEGIFDPASYQLPPAEELDPEQEKFARMRRSMVKGVPAKQQYGERYGAKTKSWAARIFHSKDYDSEKRKAEEEGGGGGGVAGTGGGGGGGEEREREEEKEREREYLEAFGERGEGEGEEEGQGQRRGSRGGKAKPSHARTHQRKSRTQVVPVENDEFGSS
jgi:hypothetical protein